MKYKFLLLAVLFLLPLCASADTLTLDCTDELSLSTFVQTVRSRNITGDTLVIADKDVCAREMIAVKTDEDEEGNVTVIRPEILGHFQFKGDSVLINIGPRVIRGKTAFDGYRLTITDITDSGGAN